MNHFVLIHPVFKKTKNGMFPDSEILRDRKSDCTAEGLYPCPLHDVIDLSVSLSFQSGYTM